jgi:hypothetical protein
MSIRTLSHGLLGMEENDLAEEDELDKFFPKHRE